MHLNLSSILNLVELPYNRTVENKNNNNNTCTAQNKVKRATRKSYKKDTMTLAFF